MNHKRQKRDHLNLFEYFPDKLIVEIFSYLNGVDAAFAFSQLNSRFRYLVMIYCRRFDFKSIEKRKLNYVFQYCDTKQWKSMRFSNDDNTPGHIEYFVEQYSHTKMFPQLESLSLLEMKIDKTLIHRALLRNLVSLTMKPVCGRRMPTVNLPQLKKLVVRSCKNTDWLKNFSRLENLEFTLIYCCSNRTFFRWPSKLKSLRITFENGEHPNSIHQSLKYLSRLNTLQIYQKGRREFLPDGQIWEPLIRSSLPMLKKFRFYFQFYDSISYDRLERVIKSFSTPFYTQEKKWFNHCELYTENPTAHLYSLPKPSNENFYLAANSHFFRSILLKLCHLEIKYDRMISLNKFSIVLDKTPNLYSLTAEKNALQKITVNWTHIPICNQLSQKIRSLKLYSSSRELWKLSRYEVNEILNSIARQCEHVSLDALLSIETIAFILRIYRSLKSLHVLITEEDYSKIDRKWLEQQKTTLNHLSKFIHHDKYHCRFSL